MPIKRGRSYGSSNRLPRAWLGTDAGRAAIAWLWLEDVPLLQVAAAFDYRTDAALRHAIGKLRDDYATADESDLDVRFDGNEIIIRARHPGSRGLNRVVIYRAIQRYRAGRK
jgi:hypothetical protein